MNLRTNDELPHVYLIPFRPDRRAADRRKPADIMERTQFRALGWSIRCKRKMSKLGNACLALTIMLTLGAFVAWPIVLGLILWMLAT